MKEKPVHMLVVTQYACQFPAICLNTSVLREKFAKIVHVLPTHVTKLNAGKTNIARREAVLMSVLILLIVRKVNFAMMVNALTINAMEFPAQEVKSVTPKQDSAYKTPALPFHVSLHWYA